MDSQEYKVLTPHVYPWWIVISVLISVSVLAIGFKDSLYYAAIYKKMKKAKRAFKNEHYVSASKDYAELATLLPNNKRIKLYAASSFFKLDQEENHKVAFDYLKNVSLTYYEWDKLLNYMPQKYVGLFNKRDKV